MSLSEQNDCVKMVKFLLKKGADKTIKNKSGKTAVTYASEDEIEALLGEEEEVNADTEYEYFLTHAWGDDGVNHQRVGRFKRRVGAARLEDVV